MKKIFLITFFVVSISSQSQSLKETTEWITDQYNRYERSVNQDRALIIEDDNLYYKWIFADNYGYWHYIQIKDIKEIEIRKKFFDSNDKTGWTMVYLYFDEKKSETKDLKGTEPPGEYEISDSTRMDILLDSSFIDEGMQPRMEKALLHLIKLNGGNAKIKKEPF